MTVWKLQVLNLALPRPRLSQNCDRSAPSSLPPGLTENTSRIIVGASRDHATNCANSKHRE
ncbi:hypothetical protein EAS62_23850 [Bradyrhizobium zhanjiangense]|uniref:Uncharacterized protein n=1 Tax=Bradyrhizobium zhanjiangense TaxID=1325107 RepID=A0ABY0DFJ9_9BRAD|nr:hypothetical protein EAS62_23850 [Bradyrhizobium zhanjiangense]